MRADGYRIADEPLPGRLERFVTDPVWPLFGMMFGGAWLGLPWFVFNGFALGSATVRREVAWALAGFAGAALLLWGAMVLIENQTLPLAAAPFLGLAPLIWKLGVGYTLLSVQRRSFALWSHYGGRPRKPALIIVAAFLVHVQLLTASENIWIRLVLL